MDMLAVRSYDLVPWEWWLAGYGGRRDGGLFCGKKITRGKESEGEARVQLILHAISKISGSTIDKGGEHQNETTPTLTIRGIHWSTIPVQFRPILNRL